MGLSGEHSGQVRPVRERERVRKRASMRRLGFRACAGRKASVSLCECVRLGFGTNEACVLAREREEYGRATGTCRTCEVHEIWGGYYCWCVVARRGSREPEICCFSVVR